MLLTFKQFKNGPAKRMSGVSVTSTDFANYTNDAVRMLMRRGSWWGTVQPMSGIVYDGFIVWPREVDSVLAMNICGHPVHLANHWFQFLEWGSCYNDLYYSYKRCGSPWVGNNDGTLPVYRQITYPNYYTLQLYCDNQQDVGKNVIIYGKDGNNQVIRTQQAGGFMDGVTIPLSVPYSSTPGTMNSIDRIVKDTTLGNVRAYIADPNGVLIDIAVWEPSETNPEYIRTRVAAINPTGCPVGITALVRLKHIAVVNDNDLIAIENTDAICNMIMSIRAKESGQVGDAVAYEKLAFRELNLEMRQRFPDEQFIMNFRPFGRDSLNNWSTRISQV